MKIDSEHFRVRPRRKSRTARIAAPADHAAFHAGRAALRAAGYSYKSWQEIKNPFSSRMTAGTWLFTFILVSSLFLLWGVCNGMIDVMDKHFQEELSLTKSQSAWVQFAHYLGYFLMSLPAGWLASKLGYKGGIIAGLLIVAAGRVLVHSRPPTSTPWSTQGRVSPNMAFVGFPGRGLRHRHRPHISRDHRQSLHHRAGQPAIRRHAHQPGPIVQRRRLDLRAHHRQHVFLFEGRRWATAPAARPSISLTRASPWW